MNHFCLKLLSSSSWGCELKCRRTKRRSPDIVILLVRMWVEIQYPQEGHLADYVILLVRMWVEMDIALNIEPLPVLSSSSWGCELKYDIYRPIARKYGHPPREDVSWNERFGAGSQNTGVILLVRMWVEIQHNGRMPRTVGVILLVRMWVEIQQLMQENRSKRVILLVRMWVEIPITVYWHSQISSSSSWGCELKFICRHSV